MRYFGSRRSSALRVALPLAAVAIVVAAWQVVYVLGLLPATAIPGPGSVVESFLQLVTMARYWTAIGDTLTGALIGLVAAVVIGVPIGLLTGRAPIVEQSLTVPLEFGRAFPAIALLPALVLIMGSNNTMKSVVVFTAVVFLLIIQAQQGARRVDPAVAETVRAFRIPAWQRVSKVVLPTAAPSIITGIQLAAAMSILLAVAVEVLAAVPGIGRELALAQQQGAPSISFTYIITGGLLGLAASALIGLIRRRVIGWSTAMAEVQQ